MKKLYMVHCGFYDGEIADGLYESHVNYFVAADSFDDAKKRVKEIPEFKSKRMHVDGMQEIEAVNGFTVTLNEDSRWAGQTSVTNFNHRELAAPKPRLTV